MLSYQEVVVDECPGLPRDDLRPLRTPVSQSNPEVAAGAWARGAGVGGLGLPSGSVGGGGAGRGHWEGEDAEGEEGEKEGGDEEQGGERDGVRRGAAGAGGEDAGRADPAHERARRRHGGQVVGSRGVGFLFLARARRLHCTPAL